MNVSGIMEYLGLEGNKAYCCLNTEIPSVKNHNVVPREDVDVTFMQSSFFERIIQFSLIVLFQLDRKMKTRKS